MVVLSRRKQWAEKRWVGFRLSAPHCPSVRLAGTLVCLLALSQWSGQVQGQQTCNLRLSSAAVIIARSHHSSQPLTISPCSLTHVISAAICFVLHLFVAVSASCLYAYAKYPPTRPKLALRSFACCMSSDWEDSENRSRVGEHEWHRRVSFNLPETIVPAVCDMNPSSQLNVKHALKSFRELPLSKFDLFDMHDIYLKLLIFCTIYLGRVADRICRGSRTGGLYLSTSARLHAQVMSPAIG